MSITTLSLLILALWLVEACESVSCPKECTCPPFDKTRVTVKCHTTGYIPKNIPFNTVQL